MLRECDKSEGSVCYCTPKRNGLVNGTLEIVGNVQQHPRMEPPTMVTTIETPHTNHKRKEVENSSFKNAFRRSENGIFREFTTCQALVICVAELLGTAILVFLGCITLVKGISVDGSPLLHTAFSFGFAVVISVVIFGHISQSHINPAVTMCALLLGRINVAMFFMYLLGQMLGGMLGWGCIWILLPKKMWEEQNCCDFCVTRPAKDLSDFQGFMAEFIATSILTFTVCGVWDRRCSQFGDAVPLKFGIAVAGLASAVGHFSGCSMNPARSFAPALFNMNFEQHWIYWFGPLLGAVFATLVYKFLFMATDLEDQRKREEIPLTNQGDGKQGASKEEEAL